MRRLALLSLDLFFVTSASTLAVMLRGNFDSVSVSLIALAPYILISIGCSFAVFLLAGLDRTPWRYTSVADHLQVVVLTVLTILLTLVVTFALNRLQPVARSLPVVQGALIICILICSRSVARFWHARRIHADGNDRIGEQPHDNLLVVGVNTLTELFLMSAKEFASQRVRVAGVLAEEPSMRGRSIHHKPILGTVEELEEILQSLEVHGVTIDRIVVATAADLLRRRSLETLLEIEKSSGIVVQFLSERLGFEDSSKTFVLSGQERHGVPARRAVAQVESGIAVDQTNSITQSFRRAKRIIDVFVAAFLIFILAPLALLISLVVALDIGFPVIFWQQRPGLYGRPFKLYKFRTMHSAHDKHRRRVADDQRSSTVGRLLRRSRLDELPQLYNVLTGEMSLIGPRPLLACDQTSECVARTFVRPGITGWAQVNGGRIISTSDKLILDIWYVQNASLRLDFSITLRTAKMILFGDQINIKALDQARNDFGLKALLRTSMVPAE